MTWNIDSIKLLVLVPQRILRDAILHQDQTGTKTQEILWNQWTCSWKQEVKAQSVERSSEKSSESII